MKNVEKTNVRKYLKQILGGIENIDVLEMNDIPVIVKRICNQIKTCK